MQFMYLKNIVGIVIFSSIFSSCDRLKGKGKQTVAGTKQTIGQANQKLSREKEQLIDEVFPKYDYQKVDTENNKKRLKEHLQIPLTDDIKNIYAFRDFLRIDYKVLIAFTCDQATINRVVAAKKMELSTKKSDDGLYFLDEFPWWDKDQIELLQPYKVGKELEYWDTYGIMPKPSKHFTRSLAYKMLLTLA